MGLRYIINKGIEPFSCLSCRKGRHFITSTFNVRYIVRLIIGYVKILIGERKAKPERPAGSDRLERLVYARHVEDPAAGGVNLSALSNLT
jgi:hypothetical protein